MQPISIKPVGKQRQLPAESLAAKGYEDDARAFVLQAQDESFDYRDTDVLANGAEARFDAFAITPALERVAPELLTLVADEVFRRDTCFVDSALEEGLNRTGCGRVVERSKFHHASGIVIDGHRDPSTKGPTLG